MKNLISIATRAAIMAGEAIIEVYTSPTANWEVERKADNSPLTLADRRSHAVIAPALEATGIPVLSEEGAHLPFAERKDWTRLWVVDPLDGTKEFLKRNGEFTVNIALVEGGVPTMGVIFVPVSRVLYIGSEQGAFKATVPTGIHDLDAITLEPIHAKAPAQPAQAAAPAQAAQAAASAQAAQAAAPAQAAQAAAPAQAAQAAAPAPLCSATGCGEAFTVVASRSHLSPETQEYIDALRQQHPDLTMVSAGSSLKLCLVAEGRADVYPRFAPTMEWDTAAGHAICRAAGCEVYRVEQPSAAPTQSPLVYNKENLLNPWFIVK